LRRTVTVTVSLPPGATVSLTQSFDAVPAGSGICASLSTEVMVSLHARR
jgi:hypothetical protein